MTRRLDDLERDVEHTRGRLDQTIGTLRQRLSTSGVADEVAGSLRTTQLGSAVTAALGVIKRNPIPAILVLAGVGWLAHRMRTDARSSTSHRRIEEQAADIPVLNTGHARIYDPDISPRHPALDSFGGRDVSADVKA
jgi:hypothetical protein